MNLIDTELKASRKFSFKEDITSNGERLVCLTPRNVALAEAMISNDSDYSRSGNVNSGPTDKYQGSTAYWMTQLKKNIDCDNLEVVRESIRQAVRAVDRENSTHLNSDKCGIDELTERLLSHKDTLRDELRDREKGFQLVKFLSEPTHPNDEEHKARGNYSFATKFCHYACLYFFTEGDDKQFQDNYSIYDSIVRDSLPYYLNHAGIRDSNGRPYKKSSFDKADKYKEYSDVIDKLRNNEISRNGFDHLLWYYHKAR